MPVDAEGVGQGEGNLAARHVRGLHRRFHRGARLGRVPQIAFKIDNAGIGNGRQVDVLGLKHLRGAEKRVHRPLGVRRDEDEAAGGGAHVAA